MKIRDVILLFIAVFLLSAGVIAQPGKYAGTEFKKLISTQFNDETKIRGLETYQLHESTLLNRIDDPERLFLQVYVKGTSRLLLFTVLTDTATNTYEILDVLQVKNVKPGLEFKSVTCRRNKIENAEIVALVLPRDKEYFTDVRKAWICDKKKKQFRWIALKGIDCQNEGYEQY